MNVCVLGGAEQWPDVGGGIGGSFPLVTFGAGIRTTPGLLGQLPLQPVPESMDSCVAGIFPEL